MKHPDLMYIRDLSLKCIIGTRPAERTTPREVVINLALECDLEPAGHSDDIADTVNYSHLRKEIAAMVAGSRFLLLEKLAAGIAAICLADRRVAAVTVTVDKPHALDDARSAAVCIRRSRDE